MLTNFCKLSWFDVDILWTLHLFKKPAKATIFSHRTRSRRMAILPEINGACAGIDVIQIARKAVVPALC